MVVFKRADTIDELRQILELQRANLPSPILTEVQKTEGFVTVKHDLDILNRMNDVCPHFIAKSEDRVVGYALSMHPSFENEIEVLVPMFSEIRKVNELSDFIVMGQICIAEDYRRQGIFRSLYEEMLYGIQPEFSSIITEVDLENSRSLNAHHKIGFKGISTYYSDNRHWELMKLEQIKKT